MKNHKFTLTELLLVCFVMTLGVAMTAATVKRWKPSAAQVACAANLQKLGVSTFQYCKDNGNTLPGTSRLENNWKMKLLPYLQIKSQKWDPAAYSVFRCPTDKNIPPVYKQGVNVYRSKNSYSANFFIIDFDEEDLNRDTFAGGRNMKDLWGPDTIILYAEDHNAGNMVGATASVRWNQPGAYAYSSRDSDARHDLGRSNYLLLDGAVESRNYEETNTPEDLWIIRLGRNWEFIR
jgi:hypothetical protein